MEKKNLTGRTIKLIAGVVAGLVLIGGISGCALSGELENRDNKNGHHSAHKEEQQAPALQGPGAMDYIELPAWLEKPFDCVDEFMNSETSVQCTEPDEQGEQRAHYRLGGSTSISITGSVQDGRIVGALVANIMAMDDLNEPIHWRGISLGDSFEIVLEKLGIDGISEEEKAGGAVTCYCYADAPSASRYSILSGAGNPSNQTQIHIWYCDVASPQDVEAWVMFSFRDDGTLYKFSYNSYSEQNEE